MVNKELILTLLNLNKIGRKTVNKLINHSLRLSLDPLDILESLLAYNFNIQDIIIAKNKSINIINYCEKNNINIMTVLDDDFPLKLKSIPDNPVIIFYRGNKSCIIDNKSVTIIGTRHPTIESKEIARILSRLFSSKNYVVVSGLAHGIDYNAHFATINENKKTLAVLPCGISNIYPSSHKALCEEILMKQGCIISEYFPCEPAYKNHFIERDRIQSALSLGVIVVECDLKSGTMHTVNFAKEQNKIICCFKHKNNNAHISGNLKLLKEKNVMIIDYKFNNLEKNSSQIFFDIK